MVNERALTPAATVAMVRSQAVKVLDAVAVATGKGEARWWFGQLAEIKATAADTGGQLTLVEVTCPPGYQGIRHVHHNEDEGFWLLEGHMDLEVGGNHTKMSTGDYAFGPRDVPHSFSAGDSGVPRSIHPDPRRFREADLGDQHARRDSHDSAALRRDA